MNNHSDKSAKWTAPGGDMDDYFDEAQALREELAEVKKKLIWLEDLEGQEDNLAARAKEVEGILAGRDEKLIAADKEIKHQRGLRAVAENTAERLERELKTERERAGKEKATLEKSEARLKAENTRLRGDKSVADLKFWSAVGLGVAGTIWGSLGNPLPSFSGDSIETAQTDPINQCVLAQQDGNVAQIEGQTPPPDPIVTDAEIFPDSPPFLMLRKNAVDDLSGRAIISDLEYNIDVEYNRPSTLILTGSISNTGTEAIEGVSFSAHYLSAANGNCRYGGTYGVNTPSQNSYGRYNRDAPQRLLVWPGETKRFTATAQLPADRAGIEGGEWRFTNPMIR
jgi:hypothetical protein